MPPPEHPVNTARTTHIDRAKVERDLAQTLSTQARLENWFQDLSDRMERGQTSVVLQKPGRSRATKYTTVLDAVPEKGPNQPAIRAVRGELLHWGDEDHDMVFRVDVARMRAGIRARLEWIEHEIAWLNLMSNVESVTELPKEAVRCQTAQPSHPSASPSTTSCSTPARTPPSPRKNRSPDRTIP
jgi:hypothetical protein